MPVQDVISPLRGIEHTRTDLMEDAKPAIKVAAIARQEEVLALVDSVGMRQEQTFTDEQLERIQSAAALWVVEDGQNATGLVRVEIAEQAMERVYGEAAADQTLYHIGTDRSIPKMKKGEANPEYVLAQKLAPDFLPEDDSLTSFELSLAFAKQRGYTVTAEVSPQRAGIARVVQLHKDGKPTRVMVQPMSRDRGLVSGLDAVATITDLYSNIDGSRQLVLATSAPFRPKGELQIDAWAKERGLMLLPPVALGDEAGFTVEHLGEPVVTKERDILAYVVELAKLQRRYVEGI